MKPILLTGLIILLALIVWFLAVLIPVAGTFQKLEPKLVEACTPLEVFPGTEDVAIDPNTRLAFISATDRRGTRGGGIFAVSLDTMTNPVRVSPTGLTDFRPHGISLWHGPSGQTRLFVISHRATDEDIVEMFDVGAGGILTHTDSIGFDAMHSPNDLVAVGPRQFYASNDRGNVSGIIATLERFLALPFSSAVYFDGDKGVHIKKGLVAANGINRSPDGKTIYIAELLKRRISIFDRDLENGALSRSGQIKLNTAPDNIDVSPDGTLWVGGHTKIFRFLAHAKDAAEIAPSHVIKIDPTTRKSQDVFISTEGEINGSSVGAVLGDTLIVGAVFDSHIMVCPLP